MAQPYTNPQFDLSSQYSRSKLPSTDTSFTGMNLQNMYDQTNYSTGAYNPQNAGMGIPDFAGMKGSDLLGDNNPNLDLDFGGPQGRDWKAIMNNFGTGVGAVKDLAGLYMGWKQMQMAKKQMATTTAFGNRNIANQAQTINNSRAALHARGLEQAGPNTTRLSTPEYMAQVAVDGSKVRVGG